MRLELVLCDTVAPEPAGTRIWAIASAWRRQGFARGHVDGLPGHFVALGGWRTTIDAFDNGERPGARRAYLRHGVVPGPSAAGRDTVRARNAHIARATTAVPAPVLVTAGQRSTAQSAVASSDPHAAPVKLPAM